MAFWWAALGFFNAFNFFLSLLNYFLVCAFSLSFRRILQVWFSSFLLYSVHMLAALDLFALPMGLYAVQLSLKL